MTIKELVKVYKDIESGAVEGCADTAMYNLCDVIYKEATKDHCADLDLYNLEVLEDGRVILRVSGWMVFE